MTDSTPAQLSPRQETIDFLRHFARMYRPQTSDAYAPIPQGSC